MTDPKLGPNEGDKPEVDDGPHHIEVAPPAADDAAPPPPPQGAQGVRNLPQHFSLLFASVCVLVGALSVWERAHVFGVRIDGPDKLAGSFLLALSGYATLIGTLNVLQGRLRGMLATFTCAFFSLYFGIPAVLATYGHSGFLEPGEIKDYVKTAEKEVPLIPDRFAAEGITFPADALKGLSKSLQAPYKYCIGQFAPGPLLVTFGGFLIIWVFLKGMFGGKKKAEPAPAPSSGRRRRR